MSAVIRVKRRIQDEPLNAFVLNCKKQKTDSPESGPSLDDDKAAQLTIVKFAGTVENQDNIEKHIKKLTKAEAQEAIAKVRQPTDVTAKNRVQHKETAHENRFKIVNFYRAIDTDAIDENKNLTVVDIERQQTNDVADTEMSSDTADDHTAQPESEANFVYDLYLPESNQPIDNIMDNLLSVHAYDAELVHESHRDDQFVDSENDSEDSNDENYFRNDYPDSDDGMSDDTSTGYDALRKAVETIDLDGDRSLSSDEADEQYITHAYDPNPEYDHDINSSDADNYDKAFANNKAKISRNKILNGDNDDEDDNSDSSSASGDYDDCLSDDYYSD